MRGSKGVSLPSVASVVIAPTPRPARNTSSAAKRPATARAVETWVPLSKARPSLAASVSGLKPARCRPSTALDHLAAMAHGADTQQSLGKMGKRGEIAGGADRALGGNERIDLGIEQLHEGLDHLAADAGKPRARPLIFRIMMRRTMSSLSRRAGASGMGKRPGGAAIPSPDRPGCGYGRASRSRY